MSERITVNCRGVKIPSEARWGMIWIPLHRIVNVTVDSDRSDSTKAFLLIHARYPGFDEKGKTVDGMETKQVDYPTLAEAEADQARIKAAVKASKCEVVP